MITITPIGTVRSTRDGLKEGPLLHARITRFLCP